MALPFEKFFRLVSYAAVFCGFLALWVSGTIGIFVTAAFLTAFAAAWFIEDSRWQIGEKAGTGLIVLALPVFYGIWYFDLGSWSGKEPWIAGLLVRMILCLTAIKLLQRKSDRDWIFLYLMAFFEVLLAAGLSISGLYLLSFILYLLVMVCAIIAFEIRKTARAVERKIEGSVADKRHEISESRLEMRVRRIPGVSAALIVFIVLLAMPLFFLLPRVGGAGFGSDGRGMSMSGFSDRVTLGDLGRIIENDNVVMRVKLEDDPAVISNLYFRGVALDTFDNRTWSRARGDTKVPFPRGGRETIRLNSPSGRGPLLSQTIYLEPLDTPVLFAVPVVVAVQGNFQALNLDGYGTISNIRTSERISYKVTSDRAVPAAAELRADDRPYSAEMQNYRSLPADLDPRIGELAREVAAPHGNRYDKAKAVEVYLQSNFGYTLEQKARGPQPLADFLFNVREGHCEYFATAMAIMLRTQGIATRVVNGFHGGDHNDTAGVLVVRQRHAHAWVEAYFPGEDSWVTFDPTPFSGQPGSAAATGITATVGKYIEALEAIWIQYFISFDDQEQRSLSRSVRSGFADYQSKVAAYLGVTRDIVSEWLAEVRGDKGLQASIFAVIYGAGVLIGVVLGLAILTWGIKKIGRAGIWKRLGRFLLRRGRVTSVEFYDRMLAILGSRGLLREASQTPLEFAYAIGSPEALRITEQYQLVRFGGRTLARDEMTEIESMLERLKKEK